MDSLGFLVVILMLGLVMFYVIYDWIMILFFRVVSIVCFFDIWKYSYVLEISNKFYFYFFFLDIMLFKFIFLLSVKCECKVWEFNSDFSNLDIGNV